MGGGEVRLAALGTDEVRGAEGGAETMGTGGTLEKTGEKSAALIDWFLETGDLVGELGVLGG